MFAPTKPMNELVTRMMHHRAIYLMQSRFINFARVLSVYEAGDACNVIGPIRLHGYLPLQAFAVKVSKREPHRVDATSGGIIVGQRYSDIRPTTRFRYRATSCYYMLYSYDTQNDMLLDQPYYPVNHPRDVLPQMKRYFKDMGGSY